MIINYKFYFTCKKWLGREENIYMLNVEMNDDL